MTDGPQKVPSIGERLQNITGSLASTVMIVAAIGSFFWLLNSGIEVIHENSNLNAKQEAHLASTDNDVKTLQTQVMLSQNSMGLIDQKLETINSDLKDIKDQLKWLTSQWYQLQLEGESGKRDSAQ